MACLQLVIQIVKFQKTYQIGKETKLLKPDPTLRRKKIATIKNQKNIHQELQIIHQLKTETITVNDTFYKYGTVTDKSDKTFVTVDNRPIEVK